MVAKIMGTVSGLISARALIDNCPVISIHQLPYILTVHCCANQ